MEWVYYDGQCWYQPPGDEKAPFQAAQDKCQEQNPNSNLVSIHSERDNNIVRFAFNHDDLWIGLKTKAQDDYQWLDGTPVDYQAWKDGEPNNFNSEQCTSQSTKDSLWYNDNCDNEKSYACRFKSTHYYSCPSGWEMWNMNCYLLQPEVTAMTFQEAEETCVEHGSHLASIASAEEASFIKSYIADYGRCGSYWTEDSDRSLCYYYSGESGLTWSQARDSCLESDSNMVIIDSAEKNEKLLNLGK